MIALRSLGEASVVTGENAAMPLCQACRHYWPGGTTAKTARNLCRHPAVERINPVDGFRSRPYCVDARSDGEACGPQGALWEAKEI